MPALGTEDSCLPNEQTTKHVYPTKRRVMSTHRTDTKACHFDKEASHVYLPNRHESMPIWRTGESCLLTEQTRKHAILTKRRVLYTHRTDDLRSPPTNIDWSLDHMAHLQLAYVHS